jgi:pimeloyl-ACP methyl ester carboxylesterase
MLKNTKIGKHVIPKFLLGLTLSVLTILILRSGYIRATSNASAAGAGRGQESQRDRGCDLKPTGIYSSDHRIYFRVPRGLMPDDKFNGEYANLHVNRVRPVYANGKCPRVPKRAIVLIHGRTIPGPVGFDTQAKDHAGRKLSLQESLAWAGIDTFAPSLLGYGLSTRFDKGLDDPCNASLPPCGPNDNPLTKRCDRSSNTNIFPLNQQATMLGVNPLHGRMCKHSSSHRFARIDVWADNVIRVIDDAIARARPDNNKVVLVGNSLGGVTVARALYPLGKKQAEDQVENPVVNKVERVVFLSSLFNRLPGQVTDVDLPTVESPEADEVASFPMAVFDSSEVNQPEGDSNCPGRGIPGLKDELWKQLMDHEELGRNWGEIDPVTKKPVGRLRAPTFSNYGWNPTVAGEFTIPTLVLHGLKDATSPPSNSHNIFNALTKVTNKVLVQVECAGHAMLWEGCLDDPKSDRKRCNDGNDNTKPYGGDSQVWAGPYSTVTAALIEWVKHGTFNGASNGHFVINESGVVSN